MTRSKTEALTKHCIYKEIASHDQHGPLLQESSKYVHVYKSLKSILGSPIRKNRLLSRQKSTAQAEILVLQSSPLQAAYDMVPQGFHPLVMCTVENGRFDVCNSECGLDVHNMILRTSAIYPLRSKKFVEIRKKFTSNDKIHQCMCVFLPTILVFREEEPFNVMEWAKCRYINVAMISGPSTCEDMKLDSLYKIIRSKIACQLDMAIHQRSNRIGLFDTVVIGDLMCTTPKLRKIYLTAVYELIPIYLYLFRRIVFATNDNILIQGIKLIAGKVTRVQHSDTDMCA